MRCSRKANAQTCASLHVCTPPLAASTPPPPSIPGALSPRAVAARGDVCE